MPMYRCPTNPTPYDDDPYQTDPALMMAGCGTVFTAEEEVVVECPECGMSFTSALEPDTVVTPAPAATPKETPMPSKITFILAFDLDRAVSDDELLEIKDALASGVNRALERASMNGLLDEEFNGDMPALEGWELD